MINISQGGQIIYRVLLQQSLVETSSDSVVQCKAQFEIIRIFLDVLQQAQGYE